MTAFERIMTEHVPLWAARFDAKSKDYNSQDFEPHKLLGVRGQFADIWRKIWKLKKALWDGIELTGEQPIEIIDDLISHLFLTRDLLIKQPPIPGMLRVSVLGPGVMEAAWKAVAGDPTELEEAGYMLLDRNPTSTKPDGCLTSHQFDKNCAYRIARRRGDG